MDWFSFSLSRYGGGPDWMDAHHGEQVNSNGLEIIPNVADYHLLSGLDLGREIVRRAPTRESAHGSVGRSPGVHGQR